MRFDAPAPAPLSANRLVRLFRWAGLWLMWAAWFVREQLGGACDHETARAIGAMRLRVIQFVMLSADARAAAMRPRRNRADRRAPLRRGSALRRVTADLRRSLRGKTPVETLSLTLKLAAAPEAAIEALAERLPRGFKSALRLMFAPLRDAEALSAHAAIVAPCDTS